MAISVGRTLNELKQMSFDCGITIPNREDGKSLKKEDYILPIREHNLSIRYGSVENTPEHLKLMLQLKSPMFNS